MESETQLYQFFLAWLYRTLCPPSSDAKPAGGEAHGRKGRRYLYVIAVSGWLAG